MSEQEFVIRAFLEFEYRVKAEDADDAEALMDTGDVGDKGECVGYSIEAVVSPDKARQFWRDEDDLRARCTCGHLLINQHTGRRWGDRELSKTHPEACNQHLCDCLAPVTVDAVKAVK
jgi:hypothetical protein